MSPQLSNGFFDAIYHPGYRIRPVHIRTEPVQDTLLRSADSEAFMDGKWQAHLATGAKPWPNDLKPGRFRFAGFEERGADVVFRLDPCVAYRDHVGARDPEFRHRFGDTFLPNALAVTTFITARDKGGLEYFLATRRNKTHDYKPNGLHLSTGGFMEIKKSPEGDIVKEGMREATEESGVTPEDLDLWFLGIAFDPWQNKPDAIFHASVNTPLEEIRRRKHDAENVNLWIPAAKMLPWLLDPAEVTVPMGLAALLWYGRIMFGQAWFIHVHTQLAKAGERYAAASDRSELEVMAMRNLDHLVGTLER